VGRSYPSGTETEGYTREDLCLATNGVCLNRSVYIPKYRCTAGFWEPLAQNPFPNLASYGNVVGRACSSHGATERVSVAPATLLCRGNFCATSQNYAAITLSCAYTNWVDWGIFTTPATTTTICSGAQSCEYSFGEGGRACAAKQNGVCPAVQYADHPL
jgi:hypothetical protein